MSTPSMKEPREAVMTKQEHIPPEAKNKPETPDPWDDPDLPVGLAPPTLPRWPFYAAAAAWCAVILFFIVMATAYS